jgi:hypothetical protein
MTLSVLGMAALAVGAVLSVRNGSGSSEAKR